VRVSEIMNRQKQI